MGDSAGHRPVDALAKRYGVARAYHGVDGAFHHVGDETVFAALAAMGLDVGTKTQTADCWAEIRATDEAQILPPVIRVRQGAPLRWSGIVPGAGSARWRIDLENGDRRTGDGVRTGKGRMKLSCAGLPIGCHQLAIETGQQFARAVVIVAPQKAWQSGGEIARRRWGITAPLYGLRPGNFRDRGIGTYDDWGALAEAAQGMGAEFAGANPVHALFPADPARCSPYSPSSRLFLNVLHIAPDKVPGFEGCEAARALWSQNGPAVDALKNSELIDYAAVAARLFPVLRALYDGTGKAQAGRERPALTRHALFDALHEHFFARNGGPASWQDWPEAFHRPGSAAVAEFARDHADRVGYFVWLQECANDQLAAAADRARQSGMAIGLYADLAVGVARDGADVWASPGDFAPGISLGAPPDGFAPSGQNWALSPFNPRTIRAAGYAPFRAMLAAVMRHAGLVRIDHILGFSRSFWVPDGLPGTYVTQPLDELLDLVAIESARARCAVIGEDLGNVPDGLRDTLAGRGILGTRVAWFELEEGGHFRHPDHYPQGVCAALSSHDLPTLRGFWKGTDIGWRKTLGQIDESTADRAMAGRQLEKSALVEFAGLDGDAEWAANTGMPAKMAPAVYGRLAMTPSLLVTVQIEDMLGQVEQANLPGTIDTHPNWRRRMPVGVGEIAGKASAASIAHAMRQHRQPKSSNSDYSELERPQSATPPNVQNQVKTS